jgi:hypothetical protein
MVGLHEEEGFSASPIRFESKEVSHDKDDGSTLDERALEALIHDPLGGLDIETVKDKRERDASVSHEGGTKRTRLFRKLTS